MKVNGNLNLNQFNGSLDILSSGINSKSLEYVSATQVKISATSGMPTRFTTSGLYGGKNMGYILAGSKNEILENTSDVTMDITTDIDDGNEMSYNWYGIYACDNGSGGFNLKAVTFIKINDDISNVIRTMRHDTGSIIDYGMTTDAYAGGKIVIITGSNRGEIRNITANSSSGGYSTFTYDGSAMNNAGQVWAIITPKSSITNYRYIGSIYNDASSNIRQFKSNGGKYYFSKIQVISNGAQTGTFGLIDLSTVRSPIVCEVTGVVEYNANGSWVVELSVDGTMQTYAFQINTAAAGNMSFPWMLTKDGNIYYRVGGGTNTQIYISGYKE